jgi:hypothetical protein
VPLKVIHQGNETVVEDDTAALIGSDASSEIRIVRPGISRRHALVSHDGTGWKIEDAGSRNGTFIDGKRTTVTVIEGPTTCFLGHPTDGEQVSLVPEPSDEDDSSYEAVMDDFDLPATPPAKTSQTTKTAASKTATDAPPAVPAAIPAATATSSAKSAAAPTRVQPTSTGTTSDVELAQLTAAIRDQMSAIKGLTWSIWAMIAVTAALIVLTLFVGILSN